MSAIPTARSLTIRRSTGPPSSAAYGQLPINPQIRTHGYVPQLGDGDAGGELQRRVGRVSAQSGAPLCRKLGLQVLDPPYPRFRFTVQVVRRAESTDAGIDWLVEKLADAVVA